MVTRRHFFKTLMAASAFLAVKNIAKCEPSLVSGRWRAKIVRRVLISDLQSAFLDDPDAGPCTKYSVGQTWEFVGDVKPGGICPQLWTAIMNKIQSVQSDKEFCVKENNRPKEYLVSCGDPTRPVILNLTRLS